MSKKFEISTKNFINLTHKEALCIYNSIWAKDKRTHFIKVMKVLYGVPEDVSEKMYLAVLEDLIETTHGRRH